ncbi:MAG: DUF1549 and DUF1553 domain-containing protein [Fimbriiglobus sp.]
MSVRLALSVLFLSLATASAQEVAIHPPSLTLFGAGAEHRVLVTLSSTGRATADLTAETKFTVEGGIASVEAGVVKPVKNGTGQLIAQARGQTVRIPITVKQAEKPRIPSFKNDIQAVLTRTGCNSGACHGALAGKGGFKLSLRAYDPDSDFFAITRQALGRRVDTEAPADSLLLKKATRKLPHAGGTRFDEDTIHYKLIHDWVAAQAPGSTSQEATVAKLAVYPPALLAQPQDKMPLLIQATYTDGRTADVTAFAKFNSSEEGVATIDEDGLVTVANSGEAGLSAIFDSRVTTIRVTSPYARKVEATAFALPKNASPIDALVVDKLRLLNIPPSEVCTDAEFLRRASLDATGTLPKPDEVAKFVADTDPTKRAKAIDRLLESPEYVDYWTHKWSDLMLVSSRKLPAPAMWSFYRSIRRSVSDNQPWDQFARSILTANGSTLHAGGGSYYVLHKDLNDLVESTTVTFMGMSINCNRCHNHPLEKWTQDQYWAMANLFSRVSLKNGTRPGEVIVQSASDGEAFHPRTGAPMLPTPLDGKPLALDSVKDRREYFADWLTAPENPYFAKALVNRVWRNYLGRGLVEAEDDLRATNPPSNPELLDYLTKDFVAKKYDVKQLMRAIMNTTTYQRSSKPLPGNIGDDRFYSRYLLRRLSAEVILDAYSDISGVPTNFSTVSLGPSGGTAAAAYPMGTRAMQLPDSQLISRFLDSFGRAERTQTCACERTADSTVGQALHLNNGQTLNDKLRDPKSRLNQWLAEKKTDAEILEVLFRHALSRSPTAEEKDRFLAVLREAKTEAERREVLEDTFWAVLTGREFLFNR